MKKQAMVMGNRTGPGTGMLVGPRQFRDASPGWQRAESDHRRHAPWSELPRRPRIAWSPGRKQDRQPPDGRRMKMSESRRLARTMATNIREGAGSASTSPTPDEKNPATGVQISQVFPASPAARAGFRAGDVITQVNDHKVTDPHVVRHGH